MLNPESGWAKLQHICVFVLNGIIFGEKISFFYVDSVCSAGTLSFGIGSKTIIKRYKFPKAPLLDSASILLKAYLN